MLLFAEKLLMLMLLLMNVLYQRRTRNSIVVICAVDVGAWQIFGVGGGTEAVAVCMVVNGGIHALGEIIVGAAVGGCVREDSIKYNTPHIHQESH